MNGESTKDWFKKVLNLQDQKEKEKNVRYVEKQSRGSKVIPGVQLNNLNVRSSKLFSINNFHKISVTQPQPLPQDKKLLNTDKIVDLSQKQKSLDVVGAFLGLSGLILAIIEFEFFFDQKFNSDWKNHSLRAFISLSTIILVGTLCKRAYLNYLIKIEKGYILESTNYHKTNEFKLMLFEVMINMIHCPPGMDSTFLVDNFSTKLTLSMDGCCMTFMLLRIYLLGKIFAHYSKWLNKFAIEKAGQENCETNITFAIKAVLKERPNQTMLFLMVISDIVFGLAVRHYEQAFYYEQSPLSSGYQDYGQMINSFWLIMITMMTVGFGDYFPRTHLGRSICIIACFWGVFVVSMMVVTLTNATTLSQKETRTYGILYRLHQKQIIRNEAATVIQRLLKILLFHKYMKENRMIWKNRIQRIKLQQSLMDALDSFKEQRSRLFENDPTPNEKLRQITEQMDRDLNDIRKSMMRINFVRESLQEIEGSQDVLLTVVNEVIKLSKSMDEVLMKFRFDKI